MRYGFVNLIYDLEDFINKSENIINVSAYSFIEPVGLAILKSIELDKGILIKNNGSTQSYMNTMFNNSFNKSKNYLPVENVKGGSIEKHVKNITDIIMKNQYFSNLSFDEKEDLKNYIYYMVGEILNNAIHHLLSPIGAVISGQVFPSLRKIQIAVVDRGVGFLHNLRKNYNVNTEEEAIRKALEKGVSSPPSLYRPYGSTINHAGYGLYVLKEILTKTNGELKIISNNGAIYLNKDGEIKKYKLGTSWTGSIVVFEFYEEQINLPLNQFFNVYIYDEDEDESLFI